MSEEEDVLLRALRQLPAPDAAGRLGDLHRRDARAAFVRAKEGTSSSGVAGFGTRFAVPVVLAGVCFFYLGWAFAAVNALAQ